MKKKSKNYNFCVTVEWTNSRIIEPYKLDDTVKWIFILFVVVFTVSTKKETLEVRGQICTECSENNKKEEILNKRTAFNHHYMTHTDDISFVYF